MFFNRFLVPKLLPGSHVLTSASTIFNLRVWCSGRGYESLAPTKSKGLVTSSTTPTFNVVEALVFRYKSFYGTEQSRFQFGFPVVDRAHLAVSERIILRYDHRYRFE